MSNDASSSIRNSGGKPCPVCGKATYSRGGIHPQCAIVQADEGRKKQLIEKRKKEAESSKASGDKSKSKRWNKKCPKCSTEVHVRLKTCACGHKFDT